MSDDELIEAFESVGSDEYLKFERIVGPPSKRPDLCAFMLLDRLVPGDRDIVAAAAHDEIYLEVGLSELASVATLDDILYLVRCGVRIDSSTDGLAMFA